MSFESKQTPGDARGFSLLDFGVQNDVFGRNVAYWHLADKPTAPEFGLSFPKIISARSNDAAPNERA